MDQLFCDVLSVLLDSLQHVGASFLNRSHSFVGLRHERFEMTVKLGIFGLNDAPQTTETTVGRDDDRFIFRVLVIIPVFIIPVFIIIIIIFGVVCGVLVIFLIVFICCIISRPFVTAISALSRIVRGPFVVCFCIVFGIFFGIVFGIVFCIVFGIVLCIVFFGIVVDVVSFVSIIIGVFSPIVVIDVVSRVFGFLVCVVRGFIVTV